MEQTTVILKWEDLRDDHVFDAFMKQWKLTEVGIEKKRKRKSSNDMTRVMLANGNLRESATIAENKA